MRLEQQLRDYAGFLDEVSLAHRPDHFLTPDEFEGDLTVVDLLVRDENDLDGEGEQEDRGRAPWLLAVAAAIAVVVAIALFLPESNNDPVDTIDDPSPPTSIAAAEATIAELIAEAEETGDRAMLEALYAEDGFAWSYNGFDGGTKAALIGYQAGPLLQDIQRVTFESCDETSPGVTVCLTEVRYQHGSAIPPAREEITFRHNDGVITSWDVVTLNAQEHFGSIGAFYDWVFENHPEFWGHMFENENLFRNTERSAELHAELGPVFSASLNG